jgi:DNA topoisomerase IB
MTWANALPEMRKTTSDHPVRRQLDAEKALAAMKRLMNFACFRVGDERDMKARDLNF